MLLILGGADEVDSDEDSCARKAAEDGGLEIETETQQRKRLLHRVDKRGTGKHFPEAYAHGPVSFMT
jgi:hypothetical protein